MKDSKRIYQFYCDPGHGWLRVPRAELHTHDIAHKISPYSYTNGKYVYLEEDMDAATFIQAQKAEDVRTRIKEHYSNNDSGIRSFNPYRHPAYVSPFGRN